MNPTRRISEIVSGNWISSWDICHWKITMPYSISVAASVPHTSMPNLEDFEDDEDDFEIDLFEGIDLAVFRNDASLVQNALLGYEWLLEEWKEEYAPTFPDDEWCSRYTHACKMLPTVKYLLDTLTVGSFFERYDLVQSLLKDDMIVQLRKFTSEELGKKYGKVAAQEAEHSEASSC